MEWIIEVDHEEQEDRSYRFYLLLSIERLVAYSSYSEEYADRLLNDMSSFSIKELERVREEAYAHRLHPVKELGNYSVTQAALAAAHKLEQW